MFLNIKENNLISFCESFNSIETQKEEIYINLFTISQISIKRCAKKVKLDSRALDLIYQIEFDRFVDEGVVNYFTLFFQDDKDKEFIRIKNIIESNIYKENEMANNNHKSNQKNSNKGTSGNNSANAKVNGNRGKQMNPNNKGSSKGK